METKRPLLIYFFAAFVLPFVLFSLRLIFGSKLHDGIDWFDLALTGSALIWGIWELLGFIGRYALLKRDGQPIAEMANEPTRNLKPFVVSSTDRQMLWLSSSWVIIACLFLYLVNKNAPNSRNILHIGDVFFFILYGHLVNHAFSDKKWPYKFRILNNIMGIVLSAIVLVAVISISTRKAHEANLINEGDDNNNRDTQGISSIFNKPYTADITKAKLIIEGGGADYKLSDTTNQLFNAIVKTDSDRYNYSFSHRKATGDSAVELSFKLKHKHGTTADSVQHSVDFRLNPNPIWEIDATAGGTRIDFDLSKFKIRELKLKGGAATFTIKLGPPLTQTDVDISTGVSEIDISIPKNAACRVEADSGFSDFDFEGLKKIGDSNYETPGFAAAKFKILVHFSGGLSAFHIKQY